ncbi:MAG: aldehyde ferredoxin oxidoreductase family protein [Candidatus Jordarchaeum sp.]|uniref:aldehyde ferredoxin oxidoreductase family protein n=1 Tax=Candidatus Jordarchaeum sp. TaxID=2823881 RepID=UPI004049742F
MSMKNGKLLRINLSTEDIATEKIESNAARSLLGSKGLAAYYLFKELRKGVDPLSPENKLIFMTGPLTGTKAPSSCRFVVCTKSPLTGAWVDSSCGGFWGPELRFAGFDGIIVEGRAKSPVYIHVDDGKASIRDAGFLWGMGTIDTISYLRERHKSDRTVRVATIGPAGERQARLAAIIADMRAAGRGGTGAVMGSKNLKAISVVGHGKIPIADSHKFNELAKEAHKDAKEGSARMAAMGTASIVRLVNSTGGWPTRNFSEGQWDEVAEELAGDMFQNTLWGGGNYVKPCYNCPIRCAHLAVIREGEYAGISDEGPEYETISLFGPNCGIKSREVITVADKMCDNYGIDTISLGNTIGFVMECLGKELISIEDIDGVDLRFGNEAAFLKAVNMAGNVYGNLGRLLANGVKRAAEKIGKGSEKFAMHVKGLEIPAYVPRAGHGHALAYAVADRGACHLRPWLYGAEHFFDKLDPMTPDGKPEAVKQGQQNRALIHSCGLCQFAVTDEMIYDSFLRMINAATGFDYTEEEFWLVGERINNLTRSFNAREGFTSKDDMLPYRSTSEPLPKGLWKGQMIRLGKMLPKYYEICGWNENGVPKKEKLKELGLDFVIVELY